MISLSWHVCQPHPSLPCTMCHLAHSTHVDAYVHTIILLMCTYTLLMHLRLMNTCMYHLAHSTHVDEYVPHTTIDVHIHAGAPKIGEHAGNTYVSVDVDHNGSCFSFFN